MCKHICVSVCLLLCIYMYMYMCVCVSISAFIGVGLSGCDAAPPPGAWLSRLPDVLSASNPRAWLSRLPDVLPLHPISELGLVGVTGRLSQALDREHLGSL